MNPKNKLWRASPAPRSRKTPENKLHGCFPGEKRIRAKPPKSSKTPQKRAQNNKSGGQRASGRTKKSYYIAFPSREAYSPVPMTCFSWSRSYIVASISWSNELLVAEKLLCAFLASENALSGGFALVCKPEKEWLDACFRVFLHRFFCEKRQAALFLKSS